MALSSTFNIIDGPLPLAGNFPPTLSKDQSRTKLEINETPDAYGIEWDIEGILQSGSIPTGSARLAPAGTGSYTSYNWYYNRLMKINGTTAAQLDIGAPEYRAMFYDQDVGSRTSPADVITFMPANQDSLWVATATGSQMMENMRDPRGFFYLGDFEQGFFVEASNRAITLRGVPFVCNASGVFSWDGKEVKEWTRPIRNNISPFAALAILADYDERLIIGTAKFVIDTATERLFDYSSTGFRFTSRTLAQPAIEGMQPFQCKQLAFLLDISASGNQKIQWESKTDNNAWFKEPDIVISQKEKRVLRSLNNPNTTCREFTMRITGVTSGIRLREIQAIVIGYSQESLLS